MFCQHRIDNTFNDPKESKYLQFFLRIDGIKRRSRSQVCLSLFKVLFWKFSRFTVSFFLFCCIFIFHKIRLLYCILKYCIKSLLAMSLNVLLSPHCRSFCISIFVVSPTFYTFYKRVFTLCMNPSVVYAVGEIQYKTVKQSFIQISWEKTIAIIGLINIWIHSPWEEEDVFRDSFFLIKRDYYFDLTRAITIMNRALLE